MKPLQPEHAVDDLPTVVALDDCAACDCAWRCIVAADAVAALVAELLVNA